MFPPYGDDDHFEQRIRFVEDITGPQIVFEQKGCIGHKMDLRIEREWWKCHQ